MKKAARFYRRRRPVVLAMKYTTETPTADLADFCDGLLRGSNNTMIYVYSIHRHEWITVRDGDWIVDDDGLHVMSDHQFTTTYERDEPHAAEPRGND